MGTILTSSQQTFVDITDQRKLSAYITSTLPKTQSEDPNVLPHEYAPNWITSNLVLTPVLFLDQTNVSPTATGVTITWKVVRLHAKPKSNNYSELTVVNVADIWSERNVWYLGRSRQRMETEYEIRSNNEWREVSRGHSTIMVANIVGRTEL